MTIRLWSPSARPAVSIVVPSRNEADNLGILITEIEEALQGESFEVLIVDDGSTDGTGQLLLDRWQMGASWLRHVRHDCSAGQSAAVHAGVWAAEGDVIVTIDGDGQNDPRYIPQLLAALRVSGPQVGIAAGQRLKRTDTTLKQWASVCANGLRGRVLCDGTRDTGCGLKAIHADVMRRLPFFDGWHRYLPALVIREGYQVVHVDVIDRSRRFGRSNYGIFDRGLRGVLDLCGVWWLLRRRRVVPQVTEVQIDERLVPSRLCA